MLDRKFILENETLVAENCRNRGVEVDVKKLVALEQQRRQVQADAEEANITRALVGLEHAGRDGGRDGDAGDGPDGGADGGADAGGRNPDSAARSLNFQRFM